MEGPEHKYAFDIRVNGERGVAYTKRSTLFSRKDLVLLRTIHISSSPSAQDGIHGTTETYRVIEDFADAIGIDRETAPSLFTGAAS